MCNNDVLIVNIYFFKKQRRTFCYKLDNDLKEKFKNNFNLLLGSLVKVEFCKKEIIGIILSINQLPINQNDEYLYINNEKISISKIKSVKEILFINLISENFLIFLKKMAWYNIIDVEKLIEIVIPYFWLQKKREGKPLESFLKKKSKKIAKIELNDEQQFISNHIKINNFIVSLIRGVMGSGKTYIYLDIVKKKLIENNYNQVLIMVPEIALTGNLIDIIFNLTGIEPIIWHSSISISKKKVYYENIINGNIRIIISTRSGLLLPYKNLSLIVIDEEHDLSYKQNETPCYHARDMAILRAKYENIPVILSSATPSIETVVNVINKKYEVFKIKKQFFNSKPPKIELINNYTK